MIPVAAVVVFVVHNGWAPGLTTVAGLYLLAFAGALYGAHSPHRGGRRGPGGRR